MNAKNWELDPKKFLFKREVSLLQSSDATPHGSSSKSRRLAIRNGFIISLGLATGLRVMEMADLKCGDLELEDAVPSLLVRNGKGSKRRRVFFNNAFRKQCLAYLAFKQSVGESIEPEHPLFLSGVSGGHLTTRAIQKVFKKYAAKVGLSSHFSIHCLRHTYACFLLKASNGNLRLVQKQLGHSKVTTTQVYADVMLPEMKKAVGRLYS